MQRHTLQQCDKLAKDLGFTTDKPTSLWLNIRLNGSVQHTCRTPDEAWAFLTAWRLCMAHMKQQQVDRRFAEIQQQDEKAEIAHVNVRIDNYLEP